MISTPEPQLIVSVFGLVLRNSDYRKEIIFKNS